MVGTSGSRGNPAQNKSSGSGANRDGNKTEITRLMRDRHARKDMLSGLFTDYFTVPATIRCDFADHTVYLDPRDTTLTPAILTKGHWNRDELERAITVLQNRNALQPDGVFFDVGANIGTQSIYAMRSGVFAGVHAFEPAPDNIKLLERNIAANALEPDVSIFRHGVGLRAGTATLNLHPGNKGAHSLILAKQRKSDDAIEISMVSLDEHLSTTGMPAHRIGLIWIDVEGHEPAVVAGAASLIEAGVPLVFEFLTAAASGGSFADMLAALQDRYTHMYCLQDDVAQVQPISGLDTAMPEGDYLVFAMNAEQAPDTND